jgi:hypothetical protein
MDTPNYLKKLAKLQVSLPPGRVSHAVIRHDQWCAVYQGRACDCDPDVSLHADGCQAIKDKPCTCGGKLT